MIQIEIEKSPLAVDEAGHIRVSGTRVTLESLLWLYKQGYAPEAVAEAFPSVPLADVYSAIAYYLRHTKSVDEYLHAREAEAEQLRQEMEAKFGKGPTKAELLARWAAEVGAKGCSPS